MVDQLRLFFAGPGETVVGRIPQNDDDLRLTFDAACSLVFRLQFRKLSLICSGPASL